MVKFGGWNVEVPHDKYPQKIASVIGELTSLIGFGCDYEAIAYLGVQNVNGFNHAVLAQQTVLNGKDTNNAVVVVLNEKSGVNDVSCTDVYRIVESGGELGGVKVEMSNTLSKEAQEAFNQVMESWTGTRITPIAYVGTQVTKGTNYIFVAEVKPVVPNAVPELAIVTVNTLDKKFYFDRLFEVGSNDNLEMVNKVGYSCTWLG